MNRRKEWVQMGWGNCYYEPSRPASDIPVVALLESTNYRTRELEEGIKELPVQIKNQMHRSLKKENCL
jgi:hypothetical protein